MRLKDIETAEKFCKRWHNFAFTESKRLKAHIHPISNPKRENIENSHHIILSCF